MAKSRTNFFLSGGAAPYTWAVAAGQLPPGLKLQTFGDPRDAMQVQDSQDNWASGTVTVTINP